MKADYSFSLPLVHVSKATFELDTFTFTTFICAFIFCEFLSAASGVVRSKLRKTHHSVDQVSLSESGPSPSVPLDGCVADGIV